MDISQIMENFKYDPDTGVVERKSRGKYVRLKAVNAGGYVHVHFGNMYLYAHRIAWAIHTGNVDFGVIDHINGDKTNNKISNLRCVTETDSQQNRPKQKNNKSGCVGICWDKRHNKWRVQIGINGTNTRVGEFGDLFSAVSARRSAELRIGFHENHGRAAQEKK